MKVRAFHTITPNLVIIANILEKRKALTKKALPASILFLVQ
ncbi:hypothetical protein HSIEG1_1281 [Enterococcus sp. HSIEG1]|nr:hypothetical protein HSIEG1_1281 [Enterococcus sp. HSIEG1]